MDSTYLPPYNDYKMDVRSRFVKVKPQPARRPFLLFTINWNIFQWRDNSVRPEPYTVGDLWEEAFPWPDNN
jgi:hypothetical protein